MNFFNSKKPKYIEFFFIKKSIQSNYEVFFINTLPIEQQNCLILKTLDAEKEVIKIQFFQDNLLFDKQIVIYGKNCLDNSVDIKFHQLSNLGFTNLLIYKGGMFEWALLQDIYGINEFPTTERILDPLKWCDDPNQEIQTVPKNWNNLLTYF